jgi:hypothetical protein
VSHELAGDGGDGMDANGDIDPGRVLWSIETNCGYGEVKSRVWSEEPEGFSAGGSQALLTSQDVQQENGGSVFSTS